MNTTSILDEISRLDDLPEATDDEWYHPAAIRRRHGWPKHVHVNPDIERLTDLILGLGLQGKGRR